jgi:osmotically-inducible protein OsmY
MKPEKRFLLGVSALAAGLIFTPPLFAQGGDTTSTTTTTTSSANTANSNSGVGAKVENAAEDVKTGTVHAYHKVKHTVEDEALEAKVKSILDENKDTRNIGTIHVDASRGVVTLSGGVGSKLEAIRAAQVASEVTGVKRVRNDLHYRTRASATTNGRESASE